MHHRWMNCPVTALAAILTLVFLIGACGDDDGHGEPPIPGDGDVEGTWTCGQSAVRMGADGTYSLSLVGGLQGLANPDVTGTYRVDGPELEITDTGGAAACPPSLVGTYRIEIDGNTCTFELISDQCQGRQAIASCTWRRQS